MPNPVAFELFWDIGYSLIPRLAMLLSSCSLLYGSSFSLFPLSVPQVDLKYMNSNIS